VWYLYPSPGVVVAPPVAVKKVEVTELLAALAAEVPLAFVAVTVYVYVPAATSFTVIGEDAPVPVRPEDEVAV
jgi:hypothetical protein